MLLTIWGRWLTRVFLLVIIGVPWVGIATPLLDRQPFLPTPTALSICYYANYTALAIILVAAIFWELSYHLLVQARPDGDWPSLLALVAGVSEGTLSWLIGYNVLNLPIHSIGYGTMFALMWLIMWGTTQGPMRVIFIRWRYSGGVLE